MDVERIQLEINELIKSGASVGELSDGYHSFNELYRFRMLYNAGLFNEWARQGKYDVHRSTHHHEGDECFGGGWFVVVAQLPTGQISNHYELVYWDLFNLVPAVDKAKNPCSKTCSCCGFKLDILPLSVREWDCPQCNAHHHRDQNAAKNIKAEGLSVLAFGECVSGAGKCSVSNAR